MKHTPLVIASALVIVLVLILLIWRRNDDLLDDGLTGVWIGAEDFCEVAEISSMMLVIGEPNGWRKHRECCVTINDDVAETFGVVLSGLHGGLNTTHMLSAELEFDDDDNVFPSELMWEYNYHEGRLVLKDDDTIYAVFFKSPESTFVAKL